MSDYDRGPYTPQTDAPLAFDARRSRDGRRAFPTTLVVSLVILAVLVIAVVMFYRSGVRNAAEGPVAVGTPVGEIKAPAPPQAQASDEAAGLQIYKAEGGAAAPAAAPGFAPPPEEPRARPTPPVTVQPITTPPPAANQPAPPPAAVVAASGATSKPATAAAPKAVASTSPKPDAAAPPKDEVAALLDKAPAGPSKAATPAKPPAAAATPAPAVAKAEAGSAPGGAVAQIGAYSSQALAAKGWSDIAAAFAADMSGKGKHFEPVVAADGKTLYRATVTGFSSKADAAAFCAKLTAAKHACIAR